MFVIIGTTAPYAVIDERILLLLFSRHALQMLLTFAEHDASEIFAAAILAPNKMAAELSTMSPLKMALNAPLSSCLMLAQSRR